MFGKRVLILVPHPDDEIVACTAAISRAHAAGSEIFALYLTHGCIAHDVLWHWERKNYDAAVNLRRAEGEKAATFLNIVPVGWSRRPARHVRLGMAAVHAEIADAIARNNIDQLWAPAYEGGNADHDAVNAIASVFATQMSVLEFAEYNFSGGKAHSQEFPAPNGSEQTITLSLAEQQKKRAALHIYASESGNLNYVKTKRECWRPLATYDYSRPPHKGTLWYARFQWVPFRHPRIDFTKPREVSKAIADFFAAHQASQGTISQAPAPHAQPRRATT
jgi:LmbE family N-acetylglucosaminyl deacetylase